MNAIVIDQYGSPEVLKTRRISTPLIEDHEVLVKVHAAGLNPLDYKIRKGVLSKFVKLQFPAIPGTDIAGVVEGTGTHVTGFKPGDEVYAMVPMTQLGGYAGYIAVDYRDLALKPKNLSFEEAAAMPTAALTALQGLRDKGHLEGRGQEVVINGASGGVGTFAVQIAKAFGAIAVGICSGKNIELVKTLGADAVIDYQKQDFTKLAATYHIVFDTIGNLSFGECKSVLRNPGTYVTTEVSPQAFVKMGTTILSGKKSKPITVNTSGADLQTLANFAEEEMIKPVIQKVYKPSEILRAHQTMEEGHVAGKLVLSMNF